MATSTLDLAAFRLAHGLNPEDDYAHEVDRLRITRDPAEDDYPWLVDGINTATGQVSMWMQSYRTHAAAVADLPSLWDEYITSAAG